jgi:hypothetical protein
MSDICSKCAKPYLGKPSDEVCGICDQDVDRAHKDICIEFENKSGDTGMLFWGKRENKWIVSIPCVNFKYDCILTAEKLVKLIKESE